VKFGMVILKSCRGNACFLNSDSVTFMLLLTMYRNFYQRFPHSLTDLFEVHSGRSPLMALITSKCRENRYTEGHTLLKDIRNILLLISAFSPITIKFRKGHVH
jgi:hypothetical protein